MYERQTFKREPRSERQNKPAITELNAQNTLILLCEARPGSMCLASKNAIQNCMIGPFVR